MKRRNSFFTLCENLLSISFVLWLNLSRKSFDNEPSKGSKQHELGKKHSADPKDLRKQLNKRLLRLAPSIEKERSRLLRYASSWISLFLPYIIIWNRWTLL